MVRRRWMAPDGPTVAHAAVDDESVRDHTVGTTDRDRTGEPAIGGRDSRHCDAVVERADAVDSSKASRPREATRRLTVDVPEGLHRKMKVHAAATGVSMVEEVRRLLEQHYRNE